MLKTLNDYLWANPETVVTGAFTILGALIGGVISLIATKASASHMQKHENRKKAEPLYTKLLDACLRLIDITDSDFDINTAGLVELDNLLENSSGTFVLNCDKDIFDLASRILSSCESIKRPPVQSNVREIDNIKDCTAELTIMIRDKLGIQRAPLKFRLRKMFPRKAKTPQ